MLSTIICRVRGAGGAIPFVSAYDDAERTWSQPAPLLLQRRFGHGAPGDRTPAIRDMLTVALAHTGVTDPATGEPLRFTPHDFRRLFVTDAVFNGLPPHIAQVIAGHRDINVTIGYTTVYPERDHQAHRAFLARRRALRPSEEYRAPSDEEWDRVPRPFRTPQGLLRSLRPLVRTPCIHEHACVRCPMLWPDPPSATG